MLGQRVHNFEIVRVLREGGMGTVYEAEHAVIGRKVAVKVLKPELATDAELLERFFNEARATSAIRHPNIVEVVDVGFLSGNVPYIVMELLEGECLWDRLDRLRRLDVDQAVDICVQAASALCAAHALGIVHRDLKPENLYLVPDERFADRELVKVLDFGIAKLRGDFSASVIRTRAGTVFGTPPYMSPEQCRGVFSELDQRTDIYALGIILYEMLCGEPPFLAAGLGDVMMMHMSTPPEPPSLYCPELPAQIEHAILKALAKRPEDRFASMAEFSAALTGTEFGELAVPDVQWAQTLQARAGGAASAGRVPHAFAASGPPSAAPTPGVHAAPDLALISHRPEDREQSGTRIKTRTAGAAVVGRGPLALALACGLLALSVGALGLRNLRARFAKPVQPVAAAASHASAIGAAAAAKQSAASVAHPGSNVLQPTAAPAPQAAAVQGALAANAHARIIAADRPERVRPRSSAPRPTLATPESGTLRSQPSSAAQPNAAVAAAAVETRDNAPVVSAQPATPPGFLSLDTAPWSHVFLGAQLLGTTPLIKLPLPAGKHVLTLKNPELNASTSYVVEIKSGTTVSRLVGWEKR